MTEPEQVEFHERIERPIGPGRLTRSGIVLGAAVLFVVGAVAVMGASPSAPPSITGASPAPAASGDPGAGLKDGDHHQRGFGVPGFGPGLGGPGFGRGGFGFGGITVTAISGSNLSLKTEDGWTRTIAVTSDTTITRAGKTIAIGDLKVGDQVGFRQDRQTDGTYTIAAINVILPSIAGTVTKVDGSTITVQRRDGTTATIHVNSDTTYRIAGGDTPALSDIKVDDVIIASGIQRTDGSLDAEAVAAGGPGRGDWFGGRGPRGDKSPNASPAPSTTPG
jgi:endonuclease YncB( thermonuclease family)